MSLPPGITSVAMNHSHTISNPESGYTDEADGHKHRLHRGCHTCAKIRKYLSVETIPSGVEKYHFHFWSTSTLAPKEPDAS